VDSTSGVAGRPHSVPLTAVGSFVPDDKPVV
jgi:hypothetical protein